MGGKDDDGNAAGEADDNRIGYEFDQRAELGKAHHHQDDARHHCCHHKAVDAVLLHNAVENDDEGSSGSPYLDAAASEK